MCPPSFVYLYLLSWLVEGRHYTPRSRVCGCTHTAPPSAWPGIWQILSVDSHACVMLLFFVWFFLGSCLVYLFCWTCSGRRQAQLNSYARLRLFDVCIKRPPWLRRRFGAITKFKLDTFSIGTEFATAGNQVLVWLILCATTTETLRKCRVDTADNFFIRRHRSFPGKPQRKVRKAASRCLGLTKNK